MTLQLRGNATALHAVERGAEAATAGRKCDDIAVGEAVAVER